MPRIFSDIDGTILRDGKVVDEVLQFLEEEAEEIVFLTNRPESERAKTEEELSRIGIEYEKLIMNPGDEDAPAFKSRVIKEQYLDKGLRADALIDDREDTRRAVARLGVEVLSPDDVIDYMKNEEDDEPMEASIRKIAANSGSIRVPSYVSENAKQGLKYYEDGRGGDGLKDKTVREAREMASGSVSEDKVRRMGPWLRRHEGDLDAPKNRDPKDPGYPGAGLVAWLLWGGDSNGNMRAAEWAERQAAKLDEESNAVARVSISNMTIEEKLAQATDLLGSITAERDDLRATVEKLTVGAASELDALKADVAAKDARIAELASALEAAEASSKAFAQKVEELEAGAKSASKEAASIVASLGVPPVSQSPAADAPAVKMTDKEKAAHYASLPAGKERLEFFKANTEAIFRGRR